MFDFEKLKVYQKIKDQNKRVLKLISGSREIDQYSRDQWKRCTLSVALNIAEATGRIGKSEKKYFYAVARGSVFESVAILDALTSIGIVDNRTSQELYINYEEISKMLLALYRSVGK